jgi:diguanylate cyclase (GGDEF)-like protein
MLDKVLNCPGLPTLPAVAVKLLELTRDPEAGVDAMGALVEKDQALSSKILRTVNSSYYRLSEPCPTIHRALAYLGLNTVKSLVLGFSVVDVSRRNADGFNLIDYWRRCLYSAVASRRIAMATTACDPDEAFLAGLLQDIGMLAIHTALGDEYHGVLLRCDNDHLRLPAVERDTLGFTHAEAGAAIGERWHLPGQIVMPIRFHHFDSTDDATGEALVRAVALGLQVATLVTASDRQAAFQRVRRMSRRLFGTARGSERALVIATCEDARELAGLLDVQVGRHPDASEILAEAEEARIRHAFAVQREAEQLREAGAQLAREALTDGLTGVGNRKFFDEQLASRFRDAQKHGSSLAIILIDVDRFKQLNDRFGHQAGDTVLKELAQRVGIAVGRSGLVCRYGGEEFAVVLPGMPRHEAAQLAERLRQALADDKFDISQLQLDVQQVLVTASFGVAALEPDIAALLKRPELLVQLADKSLYAAKQAGRNCVRVFTPKRRSDAA